MKPEFDKVSIVIGGKEIILAQVEVKKVYLKPSPAK